VDAINRLGCHDSAVFLKVTYSVFFSCLLMIISLLCSVTGTHRAQAVSTMYESIIEGIRLHDESVVAQCANEQGVIVQSILDAVPTYDSQSRMLSVECISTQQTPAAALGLLRLLDDDDVNVANAAIQSLRPKAQLAPVNDVLSALKVQDEPYIREQLYLVVGDFQQDEAITELREQLKGEEDPDAALAGLVAIVKLNGAPERDKFMAMVQAAEADDAVDYSEKLLYIGDKHLAEGLRAWLPRKDEVYRLDSDRSPDKMVRMCDIAVWTSHLLGVAFIPPLTHIDIFEEDLLVNANFLMSQ
jgi:hypothetical protein